MTEIKLTIPMDYNALTRAADMLHGLAIDVSKNDGGLTFNDANKPEAIAAVNEIHKGASVTKKPEIVADINRDVDSEVDKYMSENESAIETEVEPPLLKPVGVEVDSEGLPFDARIHTSGKVKKTKKDLKWKIARNIDPAFVEEVKTELRAAMAASPDKPIVQDKPEQDNVAPPAPPTAPPPPTPPADVLDAAIEQEQEKRYSVDDVEYTAEQLIANGWNEEQIEPYLIAEGMTEEAISNETNVTFPQIMAKITASLTQGTINQASITAALNDQGLKSLPLLAARPDLIPAVNTALFG